ncbi:MAG: hypothetical protein ACKN85_12070 [Pirellula sp.]
MKPTKADKTIDEIHEIRYEISDRFGGDVFAIAQDAARRQTASNRPLWQPKTTNKPLQPSGGSGISELNTSSHAAG